MADFIDRALATSHPFANGRYDHENANEHFIMGYESYREWLEDLPSADVRPVVRGRWVKKNASPLDGEYCCSNCKQEIDIADGEETPLNRGMNYCPSCGADMREKAGP